MKRTHLNKSHKHFAILFLAGFLIPGIAVADDTVEERLGRGKISSDFHYFTEVEYAYREADLERGGWDSNGANLKDFTVRFGVRHKPYIPLFMRRIVPVNDKPIDGHMEWYFSVTAEELRLERRHKNTYWTTTDIIHTGASPIFGLGMGAIRYGPERAPIRMRVEARYGDYKEVSYSRRFTGNGCDAKYDVQADISVFSLIVDIEWRYRLGYFEPFLALNAYDLALYQKLIYPDPSVGTSGNYTDVEKNRYGLAVGTWIKLKPDINLRLARHFFNQNAYTVQTEMRF